MGEVAGSSGVGPHIGLPLVGFVDALTDRLDLGDASGRYRVTAVTWFLEVSVLVGLVARAVRRPLDAGDQWLRLAVAMLGAFVLLLTERIWGDPADLRTMTDLFVLGWIVLILGPTTEGRSLPLVVTQSVGSALTVVLLAVSI